MKRKLTKERNLSMIDIQIMRLHFAFDLINLLLSPRNSWVQKFDEKKQSFFYVNNALGVRLSAMPRFDI